ncbi:excinuclease ABC subunit A [Lewinella marina]|uniref:UvrABC system protein A n=1 Tax=Neolewinella marina TaxID=438751 RepID=A0A2G0CC65_9BACT|nr:excinuclease ABC subunit UvrA [Neolewinella marina]NJB86773.1 excinuclease ABC subunit A [Neolewinella marina]PHK97578.1 excinuclease ABC subunit A [Neolewinella marina]
MPSTTTTAPAAPPKTSPDIPHTERYISVIGAKEHNLKDIDVELPRNQLVVITGLSGSGKSSLAFDTIYAEGQRRYMETFSSYARQFMGTMERPEVEQITGLSPVISIEQKTTNRSPRSTVGTVTEIYDFLRLLYARAGTAYSYVSGKPMLRYTEEQMLDQIAEAYDGRKLVILAPLVRGRKGHYRELFDQVRKQGYTKVRVDGEIQDLKEGMQVSRYKVHDIELVVDRIKMSADRRDRLSQAVATSLKLGEGLVFVQDAESGEVSPYSKNLMDAENNISYEEPSPNTFSFNSPYGYCPTCKGLGQVNSPDITKIIPDRSVSINKGGLAPLGDTRDNTTFKQIKAIAKAEGFKLTDPIERIPPESLNVILYGRQDGKKKKKSRYDKVAHDLVWDVEQNGLVNMIVRWYEETTSERIRSWAEEFMTIDTCPDCEGARLRMEARHYKIKDKTISDLARMDLGELGTWMETAEEGMDERTTLIATDILKEIRFRLQFLLHVGLGYLSLDRPGRTLSGGEAQRIRLATQIGSQLTGITYILDEPSIGLHQRDNQRLIRALRDLTDIGNTVLVVEHDKDIMMASDYLLDLGPGAGALGGAVVTAGKPEEFLKQENAGSITSDYLAGRRRIEIPETRRKGNGKFLTLKGAQGNNLKGVDIKIPLGTLTCVTGVSGSGKSTLINETLYPILRQHFYNSVKKPMEYGRVYGLQHIDKVIDIDQSPIGRTPRSNPATYTGVFTDIRQLFTKLPEAMIRGYKPGRFSFNVKGGRCEVCKGSGMRTIEMNFLPDVEVKCENCQGMRFNRETLEILYKGKSITDVLNMSVAEAAEFFEPIPKIYRRLKTLRDVGLGYITLGQRATTLSGGEAQRVKLAEELSKRDTGQTVYILDEPTTGLHFEDIKYLLRVLQKLVDKGNTVIVIEHTMDVIKVADYLIDMGPEGGRGGGTVVATGTPEEVASVKESHTGRFLVEELQ